MSKKRSLTLALALLPLVLGGAIVATLAKGSRSNESTPAPSAAAPHVEAPSDDEQGSSRTQGRFDDALLPAEGAPASSGAKEPSSSDKPQVESDQASDAPMFASEGAVDAGGEGVVLAELAPPSRRAIYSPGGGSRSFGTGGAVGGGGGGGTDATPSGAGGSGENPPTSDETPPKQDPQPDPEPDSNGDGNGPGESPDVTPPPSEEDEPGSSDKQDPTTETPVDQGPPPVYFPPEQTKPPVVQVPEPATIGLLGLGLLGCAAARRRKKVG